MVFEWWRLLLVVEADPPKIINALLVVS